MPQKTFKTHQIFKKDKWNMINAEVHGSRIVVRVISDQWGEDNFEFLSRPALMHWVEGTFTPERFDGTEEERQQIIEAFKQV